MSSIFYKTDHLSLDQKLEILIDSHIVCQKWWYDELKYGNVAREEVEMDFGQALKFLKKSDHFTIIKRTYPETYFEVGYCISVNSLKIHNRYLWIICSFDDFTKIINKHQLLV